jgi:tRNA splicing endonuclease
MILKPGAALGAFTPQATLPSIEITEYGSLFIIPETCESRDSLFNKFVFGQKINNLLVLSPYEIFFLVMIQAEIHPQLDVQELWTRFSTLFAPGVFARNYAVYHYYRCALWVVRDGTVFGAHFMLYPDHPDIVHSQYAVVILDDWENRDQESVLASRIGWSVKKETIFVRVVIPEDADLTTPACLQTLEVEDLVIQRVKFK